MSRPGFRAAALALALLLAGCSKTAAIERYTTQYLAPAYTELLKIINEWSGEADKLLATAAPGTPAARSAAFSSLAALSNDTSDRLRALHDTVSGWPPPPGALKGIPEELARIIGAVRDGFAAVASVWAWATPADTDPETARRKFEDAVRPILQAQEETAAWVERVVKVLTEAGVKVPDIFK